MAKPRVYKFLGDWWCEQPRGDIDHVRYFPTWAEAIAYALSLSEKVSQP